MKRYKLLFGLLGTLLLASCDKDIEFTGKITEPMMVMNALTTPDSLLVVKVTKSHFFLSSVDTFETVKNAQVLLYINNVFIEQLAHLSNGIYSGTYKTVSGDLVHLVISAPGIPSVESEILITEKVDILSFDTTMTVNEKYPIFDYYSSHEGSYDYTYDTIGWQYAATINMTIKFREPGAETNYYRLLIRTRSYYNDGTYYEYNEYYDKSDVVFGESNSVPTGLFEESNYNYYGVFSDELINGKDYPLKFSLNAYITEYFPGLNDSTKVSPQKVEFIINMQSISKSLYLYLKTSSSYSGTDLFSEPVQIYTNISGGIGLFGCYTSQIYKLTF